MKTCKLLFSAILFASALTFVACEKDDVKNLTKEEAQTQINTGEQELQAKSGEIVATDGYKIQNYFYNFSSPFVSKSLSVKGQENALAKKLMDLAERSFMVQNPEIEFHFDYFIIEFFNDVKGTWNWTPNGWTHETTPTDKVVVKFPYPQTSTTNNVTITYYDFTSTLLYGQTVPTGIKVKIEYNGNQVFTLAYSATIANMLKYSTKVDVTFGPFALSMEEAYDASVNNKVLYNKTFTFKKDGKTFYSERANLTLTILNDQSANILINATQVIGNLEFRLKIEGNTNDLGTGDPNNFVSLSLYTTGGDKIGDFVFVKEADEWVIYFKFNNGEQVKAETLMPLVTERFSSFLDDLFSFIMDK